MPDTLNLHQLPLEKTNLIEASAGTGKTYTITGLFVRLLLEKKLRVEQILVVTFTEAATAELRDRIRQRLVDVLTDFKAGYSDDPFIQTLLQKNDSQITEKILQLEQALLAFDQASIYTIHGFCKRVLTDSAFESQLPFDMTLLEDQVTLQQQIMDEFWIKHIQNSPDELLTQLQQKKLTPDSLLKLIAPSLGKPYLIIDRDTSKDIAELTQQTQQLKKQASVIWLHEKDDLLHDLLTYSGLSRNKYRVTTIEKKIAAWEAFFLNDELQLPDKFELLTLSKITSGYKKVATPLNYELFSVADQLATQVTALEQAIHIEFNQLLDQSRQYLEKILNERKQQNAEFSFDDLLNQVNQLLQQDAEQATRLRQSYQAALIDEFQDTDPIQLDIFRCIYHESDSPLYLVGDPKQAIYSFRGADIYAYLRAKLLFKDNQHTLTENWRSSPEMIKGFNQLFGLSDNPFRESNIPFIPAVAAPHQRIGLVDSTKDTALRLQIIPNTQEKPLSVKDAENTITEDTVEQIVTLLNQSESQQLQLNNKPLKGSDIAVLVRTHRHAQLIQQALHSKGLGCATSSKDNVFASPEARDLLALLQLITQPTSLGLLRLTLTTSFFYFNATQIDQLNHDDSQLNRLLNQFYQCHLIWTEQGFMPMFNHFYQHFHIEKQLLGFFDGERKLTNMNHLAELLHQHNHRVQGIQATLRHLSQQISAPESAGNAHLIRLESDQNLIQVLTVHKSKGLQYPIVFCPFMWKKANIQDSIPLYHDPDDHDTSHFCLSAESKKLTQAKKQQSLESDAENQRLLYVAITRAQYRCYLYWGYINQTDKSPLGWLFGLHKIKEFSKLRHPKFVQYLQNKLGEKSDIAFILDQAPLTDLQSSLTTPSVLHPAKQLQQPIPLSYKITSFSGLAHQVKHEKPDHDQRISSSDTAPLTIQEPQELNVFNFPRGATAGTCLHEMFEHIEFTDQQHDEAFILGVLQKYHIESTWLAVAQLMIKQVLETPLNPDGLQLSQLHADQKIVEMEFYFPLSQVSSNGLKNLLQQAGIHPQFYQALNFSTTQGFLKGFIDLIFEDQGKYYVLDYKSNWLGDSLNDYQTKHLTQAIAQAGYYLQYLLYTYALHKYLSQRLTHYDYDEHIGGVFYVFLRGMGGAAHPQSGVYTDKPSRQLIEAMEQYLNTGQENE